MLGVGKDATEKDIKLAYRRLARKLHPDMNKTDPNAKDKFIELQEAYEVLIDSQKRQNYDQYGFSGVDVNMSDIFSGGIPGIDELFRSIFSGGFGGIGDIFGGGFGSRTRRAQPRREVGQDIEHRIKLKFEEAIFGLKRDVTFQRFIPCDECEGTGALNGEKSNISTCSDCNGTGRERRMTRSGFGTIIRETECSNCRGTGEIVINKCKTCKGRKVIKETKTIKELKIPPGVEDGVHLKMQGAGHIPSSNAIPGDLYLRIDVEENNDFIRRGNDLYTKADIDIVTAIIGGKIKVPTLDYKKKEVSEKELDIPAGTQFGTEFRFKNHGVSYLRGKGRGDQYVIANILMPSKLTEKQKELLKKFRDSN